MIASPKRSKARTRDSVAPVPQTSLASNTPPVNIKSEQKSASPLRSRAHTQNLVAPASTASNFLPPKVYRVVSCVAVCDCSSNNNEQITEASVRAHLERTDSARAERAEEILSEFSSFRSLLQQGKTISGFNPTFAICTTHSILM